MDNPWLGLGSAKDEDIPLFSTALLIAKDEYPDLDRAGYETLDSVSRCGRGARSGVEGRARGTSHGAGVSRCRLGPLFQQGR